MNGEYIKFSNGFMLCTKIIDVSNIQISNSDNALKYAVVESSLFPDKFKELYNINAFGSGGPSTFLVGNGGAPGLDKTGSFVLYSTANKTLPSGTFISVIATGTWK